MPSPLENRFAISLHPNLGFDAHRNLQALVSFAVSCQTSHGYGCQGPRSPHSSEDAQSRP